LFWCSIAQRMPVAACVPFDDPDGVGEYWQNSMLVLLGGGSVVGKGPEPALVNSW
jgi:hypothetical protein